MLINNSVPNRRRLGHVVRVLAAPHQEPQGSQESLDPRDHPAIVDLKDPRAQEETQDKGSRGKQGPKGDTGPSGSTGLPGSKGEQGARGIQGPQGTPGSTGALQSNWKQCVFKNLDNGQDTGLIKVNNQLNYSSECHAFCLQIEPPRSSRIVFHNSFTTHN